MAKLQCPGSVAYPTVVLAVIVLSAVLTGCGGGYRPERVAVHGDVTLDNEPLPSGTITFVPQGEGTAASGDIVNGRFEIPRDRGPSPGRSRVEILSYQETGHMSPGISDDGSGMVAEVIQVVPSAYNAQSQLEQELQSGSVNECRFELSSTAK